MKDVLRTWFASIPRKDTPQGSFQTFYAEFLNSHQNASNKRMHVLATLLGLAFFISALITNDFKLIIMGIVLAYLIAWSGHIIFEKSVPATFRNPLWAIVSELRLFWDVVRGEQIL